MSFQHHKYLNAIEHVIQQFSREVKKDQQQYYDKKDQPISDEAEYDSDGNTIPIPITNQVG